jgi:hypothetical protein
MKHMHRAAAVGGLVLLGVLPAMAQTVGSSDTTAGNDVNNYGRATSTTGNAPGPVNLETQGGQASPRTPSITADCTKNRWQGFGFTSEEDCLRALPSDRERRR